MRRDGYCIEIIVTGDEILFGRIFDTNSHWLAERVTELGARLRRVTCVGDEIGEIGSVLLEALERESDLIIMTGGLGPSEDDLTVEAISRAVGRDVVHDQGTVEKIRRSYSERGVHDTARGERMARVVDGAKAIPNPVGMAVGMMLPVGGSTVITFPGIPEEMKAMFNESVAQVIEEGTPTKFAAEAVTARIVFRDFFPIYRKMQQDYPDIYIKNAATPPMGAEERLMVHDIKVDIVVESSSRDESVVKISEILDEFRHRLESGGGILLVD
jgi:molybdenum cofactor synthesis domain-containing protein